MGSKVTWDRLLHWVLKDSPLPSSGCYDFLEALSFVIVCEEVLGATFRGLSQLTTVREMIGMPMLTRFNVCLRIYEAERGTSVITPV